MTPLLGLPLGAWLIETGTLELAECGFKVAFDLPCISCGSTRATIHLLHGDLLSAIALQPMTLTVYAFLLAWGLLSLWAFVKRKSMNLKMSKREDLAAKFALIAIPLVNWSYLVWAGI